MQKHDSRNSIAGNSISSIGQLVMQTTLQNRAKTIKNKWKPEFSRFKLKCYYKDGNSSVHYSYDMFHKYTAGIKQRITDEQEGLTKLLTYIFSVQHKIKTAVIWLTFEKEQGTEKSKFDSEIYKGVTHNKTDKFETILMQKLIFKNDGTLNLEIAKMQIVKHLEEQDIIRKRNMQNANSQAKQLIERSNYVR